MLDKQLDITKMAYGARGVSKQEGKVYFAENCVPGDRILADIIEDKGRFAHAMPKKWLEKSPLRNSSPCAFSGACGGCQWLDISLENQMAWKKEALASSLVRIGKLEENSFDIETWMHEGPSGPLESCFWRNRIRLRGSSGPNSKIDLFFLGKGSHKKVSIDQCKIAMPAIQSFLTAFLQESKGLCFNHLTFQMEVTEIFGGWVLVTFYIKEKKPSLQIQKLIAFTKKLPKVAYAGIFDKKSAAPFFVMEKDLSLDFYIKPGQFYQVNLAGNRRLRRAVAEFADSALAKRVLDVYCGSGNLSLCLAKEGRKIMGVESNPVSIDAARYSAQKNKLGPHFNYEKGDATKKLAFLVKAKKSFDFMICDPPRSGLGKSFDLICQLEPKSLVFIGCEPNHFSRDLGRFIKKGYALQRLVLADFFPGSFHFESIAFLQKS